MLSFFHICHFGFPRLICALTPLVWDTRLFLPSGVCDDLYLHSSASPAPHYPPAWRIRSAPLIGPAPPCQAVSGSDRVTCFLALPYLRLPPGSPGAFGNVLVWSWAVELSPQRRLWPQQFPIIQRKSEHFIYKYIKKPFCLIIAACKQGFGLFIPYFAEICKSSM